MFLYLANSVVQKLFVFQDPWYFLWVLGNTFWTKQDFFIRSTIGIMGWLDGPYPSVVYFGFAVLFGMLVFSYIKDARQRIPFGLTAVLACIIGGTVIGIMYYFYIYGTPVSYPSVDSIQGRYLLPMLPFIMLLIFSLSDFLFRHKKIAFIFLSGMFLLIVVQQIYYRYYDYSRVFDTADILLSQEKELQSKGVHTSIELNKSTEFIYEVKFPNYKIGGFQFLADVDVTEPVTVPYRFELKDSQCKNIIRSGYFDLTELHRPHIYTQLLPITSLNQDHICLHIEPLYGMPTMRYVKFVTSDDKPVINFLYIKK